jgi:hypothetical protein
MPLAYTTCMAMFMNGVRTTGMAIMKVLPMMEVPG